MLPIANSLRHKARIGVYHGLTGGVRVILSRNYYLSSRIDR